MPWGIFGQILAQVGIVIIAISLFVAGVAAILTYFDNR